jgi:hypothetical protein
MMIDNVGARLDGLVEVAFEFYNRRMTLASELPKTPSAAKEPRKASSVDPPFPPYSTSDKSSFAYKTVKDRWPVLITKTIADVEQTIKADDTAGLRSEGMRIIRDLVALKEDMEQDRPLRLIADDRQPNLMTYNEELRRMNRPTWRNVSWLYSECYLYRLLHSVFETTVHWKRYDPFFRQKDDAFKTSKDGVLELAERFREFADGRGEHSTTENPAHQKLLFEEMAHICLWGNASDLSFSLQGDASVLQERHHRTDANKNILVVDPFRYGANLGLLRDRTI